MKFCANLSFMFNESSSLLERYALAKKSGFKAVETGFPLGFTRDQVKEAKEKAAVEQVLINLRTGDVSKGELGIAAVPGKEHEFRDNLIETIGYAKALSAKKIHLMSGKLFDETSTANWNTFRQNLEVAANLLRVENMVGLIEPINQHSVPHYFLSDYKIAVDLLKSIKSDNLKLQLDIFHMQQICGDLTHHIKLWWPYIGHVQIAQVPGRHEPDTAGEINYEYILRYLESLGYDDWVGLEYIPASNTQEGLKWIEKFGYTL